MTIATGDTRATAAGGLSVVLPTLNLEGSIEVTVTALRDELRPLVAELEFIIVDDGSTDGTLAAATRLCARGGEVRLLQNQRNFGKGVSVYLGVLAAAHANVCFTDADLAFTPGSYAKVIQRLLAGGRFVVGSRRMPDSEILVRMGVLGYAARRHLVGVAFNQLVRGLLGLPFRDTQCGLKAFDRSLGLELFRRVRSPRFLFDIELFLAARELRVAVDEVPVCVRYNDFKSSVRLVAESSRMLAGLVSIAVAARAGRYREPNPEMDPERVGGWSREIATLVAGASSA
jgi:glycosyltransferase involved in cell wall biosynthesis